MRVTETMRYSMATLSQARVAEQLSQAVRRASTGLKIETASDDPVGYAVVAGYDGTIARLTNRSSVVGRAADELDLADGALSQASDVMSRAREIAVEMANGALGAKDRANAALEVKSLQDQLLGIANTKGSRGYLFGGTATGAPPFTSSGLFVGNNQSSEVEIADGVTAPANVSGAKAFTAAGGHDAFADLSALAQALASNDLAGIQQSVDQLEASHGQMVAVRGEAGVMGSRLRAARDMTAASLTTLQSARAGQAEVDPVEAYSRLTLTKAAYERSIQVTAQILQLSSISRT